MADLLASGQRIESVRWSYVAAVLAAFAGLAPGAVAREAGGTPVALVTAESENLLLAVDPRSGRVLRRVALPADPENVAAAPSGPAVVVSAHGAAVSILAWRSLRRLATLRGFRNPHLAAISPDGEWAYVSDDGSGLLSAIELARRQVVAQVRVGPGAHHLAFSPDGRRLWVALGERARTIVVVDTSRPARPRVVARFDPGFAAHDLVFAPDGRRVWVSSDTDADVHVLAAGTRRELFRVPVGPPPQHVAFGARGFAYATSGYGSRIVEATRAGRVVRSAETPYGSFNLATSGGLVVVSSLLRGTVTELDDRLRLIHTSEVAPAARDVALSVW